MTASLFDRPSDAAAAPDVLDGPEQRPDDAVDGDPDGPFGDLLGGPGAVPIDAILDLVAIRLLAAILAVVVAFDLGMDGRWPLAVAFLGWAPGWAVVRSASIRASSLSLLTSVGLSAAMTMLVSQGLIAWGWSAWRIVVVLACLAVVVVLGRDLRRLRS